MKLKLPTQDMNFRREKCLTRRSFAPRAPAVTSKATKGPVSPHLRDAPLRVQNSFANVTQIHGKNTGVSF